MYTRRYTHVTRHPSRATLGPRRCDRLPGSRLPTAMATATYGITDVTEGGGCRFSVEGGVDGHSAPNYGIYKQPRRMIIYSDTRTTRRGAITFLLGNGLASGAWGVVVYLPRG